MNGPENYRKAEELAKLAARYPDSSDAPVLAQLATAHATLALTAATVEAAANAASAADINSLTLDAWYPLTHGPQAEEPAARCAECGDPVNYPTASYCSTACRNRADRHDVPGVSGE